MTNHPYIIAAYRSNSGSIIHNNCYFSDNTIDVPNVLTVDNEVYGLRSLKAMYNVETKLRYFVFKTSTLSTDFNRVLYCSRYNTNRSIPIYNIPHHNVNYTVVYC